MTTSYSGNSLAEYALPFALIGIVGLGILASMMPGFQEALPGLVDGNRDGKNSSRMLIRPTGINPYSRVVRITLENGNEISLLDYPSNMQGLVETMGADGTTEMLLANLQELAEKLLANGEITQDQFNQLSALANQGHRLAAIEKLVADKTRQSNGNIEKFRSSPVIFEGREYVTVTELANELGSLQVGGTPRYQETPAAYENIKAASLELLPPNRVHGAIYGKEMLSFIQQYQAVNQNGALQNPGVKSLVQNLSSQIAYLADSTTLSSNLVYNPVNNKNPNNFSILQASRQTNRNAAEICKTGGSQDSGISCSR